MKKLLPFVVLLFVLFAFYLIEPFIIKIDKILFGFMFLLCGILFFVFWKKRLLNYSRVCGFIFLIGMLIRLFYVIDSPFYVRQHDLGDYDGTWHLGYVYTIYETGKLPSTNKNEFYHPPLYHVLGALTLKITSFFSFPLSRHFESLQYLSLIISFFTLFFIYKIIDFLLIEEKYRFLMKLLITFSPLFIMFSGAINNDILMFLNFCISLFYLLKWNDNPSVKNIAFLAIFTGLCVSSKMNGSLIAIPILFLFLKKLFSQPYKMQYFKQFVLFGFISLPIGLWFYVRNYLLFHQGLSYVLSPNLPDLYVGNYSLFQRIFSFSFRQFFEIFAYPYNNDYNIWAYLLKTSVFDEEIFSVDLIHLSYLFLNTFLVILSLYYFLRYLLSYRKNNTINTLLITWFFFFLSYLLFNIRYPYACSMDFRYIFLNMIFGVIIFLYELSFSKKQSIYHLVFNLSILMSGLSIVMIFTI